jgi:Glycogen debranching enzyme, glucanotransferase domain
MSEVFKRRPIPQLTGKGIYNRPAVIHHTYPVGGQDFFRKTLGEVLDIKVAAENEDILLKVSHNISGKMSDITFEKKGLKEFHAKIPLTKCGIFHFRVKYSFNGRKWHWDKAPSSYFLVAPPIINSVKMYTLIPNASGDFNNWKKYLHHIKDIGFNVIHLLPITEMGTQKSPYEVHDLFKIDPHYAIKGDSRDTLEQFEDFMQEAKSLNIGLCIDLVLNHVGVKSRIATHFSDWIIPDAKRSDGLKRAGYWDNNEWKEWEDLVLINYDHPIPSIRKKIWEHMKEYVLFWANYADYTNGMIRFDNLHSTNHHFLFFLTHAINEEFPHLGVFAELFTDLKKTLDMTKIFKINLLLSTPWVIPYAEQTRILLENNHKFFDKLLYLHPITSHDSPGILQQYGHIDAIIPRYVIAAFLDNGHVGITQGVEFGYGVKINFVNRLEEIPFLETSPIKDFCPFFKKVNSLIEEYPLFKMGENLKFIDNGHPAVLAGWRYNPENQNEGFIVMANLDTTGSQTINLNFAHTKINKNQKAINLLNGKQEVVQEKVTLGPCEARLLKLN